MPVLQEPPEDKIVSALVIELQEVDVYIVFDKNADLENNKLYIEAMCLMNNSIEIDGSYLLSFEIDYNFDNNEFVESNKANGELVLKQGDKIITASNFITEVGSNLKLYEAFKNK